MWENTSNSRAWSLFNVSRPVWSRFPVSTCEYRTNLSTLFIHSRNSACLSGYCSVSLSNSGSRNWRDGGAQKQVIYMAALGGHLWYGLFLQDLGGHGPLDPPPDLLPLVNPRDTSDPISFFFMQFSGKNWPNKKLALPPLELVPSYGKS